MDTSTCMNELLDTQLKIGSIRIRNLRNLLIVPYPPSFPLSSSPPPPPLPPPPQPPCCSDINDYVLKVAGEENYIHGSCELIQFTYIVRCLSKKEDIQLALVKKVDPDLDNPRDIPDVSHVIGI